MRRLRQALEKAHKEYRTHAARCMGRLNDELLSNLVGRIRKEPTLDNFIIFTSCLNFFYSTRLQGAVDKEVLSLRNTNKVIIRVAKELKTAWDRDRLNLKAEKQGGPINVDKVERLRKGLKKVLNGRAAYSFCTKVFHQLNSQYPILDSRINKFMGKEKFRHRVNFYSDDTPYGQFYTKFQEMMKTLQWPMHKVNELDNAIWVYFDKFQARYQSQKQGG